MDLETKDILGVELLATGTWFGKGSPPEGDTYTEADLDAMVLAAAALPLKRPVKLGHDAAIGDSAPAVGWVENLRRVGDKLLGDLKAVPSKVAALISAGAYGPRSAEVYWNYPGEDGTTYARVFKALALLGATMPAVSTLDDIVALYSYTEEPGDVHVYTTEAAAGYAAAGNAEDADLLTQIDGFLDKMEPTIRGMKGAPRARMWLAEARKSLVAILAKKTATQDQGQAGTASAAKTNAQSEGDDPMKERVYALLGLADDVSEDDALATIKALSEQPQPGPDLKAYVAKDSPEYAELRTMAEEGRAAKVRLYEMERKSVLDAALESGRIVPADIEKWTARYDSNTKDVREILSEIPVRVDFKVYGGGGGGAEDGPDLTGEKLLARARAYQEQHPNVSYRDCMVAASKEA